MCTHTYETSATVKSRDMYTSRDNYVEGMIIPTLTFTYCHLVTSKYDAKFHGMGGFQVRAVCSLMCKQME